MKYLLLTTVLAALLSACSTVPEAKPLSCNTPCNLDTHSENINATYQVQNDRLIISLSGKTTGWVAIGFDSTYYMKNAYIVMGYIDKEGNPVISNEFGSGYVSHQSIKSMGGKPDVKLISGNFKDGWTNIKFSIPLKSDNDNYAKTFEPGKTMKVLVAYGPDSAKNFTTIHEYKTITSLNLKQVSDSK